MEIIIIGAGGHAKVIVDIIEKRKECLKEDIKIYGVIDDFYSCDKFLTYDYLGKLKDIDKIKDYKNKKYIIAIGKNEVRKKISKDLCLNYVTLIHPSAIIAKNVNIGLGTVIMAGVVINNCVSIGNHVILNTSSVIEHDCIIEDYTHISPLVGLAGGVYIGKNSWIGIASTVIQNIRIEKNVFVGAGSVVIKNIEKNKVVIGIPAKEKK